MASPASILIVEDEWVVARDMQRCLEDAGYVTAAVGTSSDALREIDPRRPDLVLIDIVLGRDDGIALAARLREQDIPFVYVTAHTDPDTLGRAKETEPLGYVVKPFDDRQLRSTIELALHESERRRKRPESEGGTHTARARVAALEQGMQRIADLVKELGLGSQEGGQHTPEVEALLARLSSRERQIVELLLSSRRVPGIAVALGISPHTVRNHLKAVFRKLDVHSQEGLLDLLHAKAAQPPSPVGLAQT